MKKIKRRGKGEKGEETAMKKKQWELKIMYLIFKVNRSIDRPNSRKTKAKDKSAEEIHVGIIFKQYERTKSWKF